jgi:hypothetical protein|tara:strand:- start:902 stop:1096 length:195 start_codon:yes stop_codon:yes gene_type:complete
MAAKKGLYANIDAKKKRVAAGKINPATGKPEKMRKKGQAGAPSASSFKLAAKTAKKPNKPKNNA